MFYNILISYYHRVRILLSILSIIQVITYIRSKIIEGLVVHFYLYTIIYIIKRKLYFNLQLINFS